MNVVSVRDIGAVIRDRRKNLHLTQAELATLAGVTRQWLIGVEQGKRTAELALVLRCLHALGLRIDLTIDSGDDGSAAELDAILGDR